MLIQTPPWFLRCRVLNSIKRRTLGDIHAFDEVWHWCRLLAGALGKEIGIGTKICTAILAMNVGLHED